MKKRMTDFPIYKELAMAYDYYNKELFGDSLPLCILRLTKKDGCMGYFHAKQYESSDKTEIAHEIAMNVNMMALRIPEDTLATVVHEMVHLKLHELDKGGRSFYHNKAFAQEMRRVGLVASATGREGGAETGQRMSHYIERGGIFEKKTREFLNKGFFLPFVAKIEKSIVSYPYEKVEKMTVGRNMFKDDNGRVFKGKPVKCGFDKSGKPLIKIVVEDDEEKEKWKRYLYKCKCDDVSVWGRKGLRLVCKECEHELKMRKE